MNISEAKDSIKKVVQKVTDNSLDVTDETRLIGDSSPLDSMKLVEICLALEEVAEEYGFEFDWTSETTMSKSRSMFRSVGDLAEELIRQSNAVK